MFDVNTLLVGIGFNPEIVAILLGPLLTTGLAAVDLPHWSATKRRVFVIVAAAVLSVLVWVFGAYPAAWQYFIAVWGVILASAQTSFTILKKLGFVDWVGCVTPGGEPNVDKSSD